MENPTLNLVLLLQFERDVAMVEPDGAMYLVIDNEDWQFLTFQCAN